MSSPDFKCILKGILDTISMMQFLCVITRCSIMLIFNSFYNWYDSNGPLLTWKLFAILASAEKLPRTMTWSKISGKSPLLFLCSKFYSDDLFLVETLYWEDAAFLSDDVINKSWRTLRSSVMTSSISAEGRSVLSVMTSSISVVMSWRRCVIRTRWDLLVDLFDFEIATPAKRQLSAKKSKQIITDG